MTRVLIFGGTVEGRELACSLASAGVDVTVSVATDEGARALPAQENHLLVHIARLSEGEMARFMALGSFDQVVDATHPYAAEVSANIRRAADAAGLPLIRIVRPAGDTAGCTLADSVDDAVRQVSRTGNVLATTGSKEIGSYAALPGFRDRLYARVLDSPASVDACRAMGLSDDHILAERGPFSLEENLAEIDRFVIETLVTKDGGTAGGYPAKLEACRMRGVDVIVVRRPDDEDGLSMEEALHAILAGGEEDVSCGTTGNGAPGLAARPVKGRTDRVEEEDGS